MRDFVLFVDTETSGLPSDWNKKDADHWPFIVQLAWVICDNDGNVLKERNYLVKPKDYHIASSSVKVHGITEKQALRLGIERKEALTHFYNDLKQYAPLIVAHFKDFDQNMLKIGFKRAGLDNIVNDYPWFCTMLATSDYMQFANRSYPRLGELYLSLFKISLEHEHDALYDAKATSDVFFELYKRGEINDHVIEEQSQQLSDNQSNSKGCLNVFKFW